MIWWVNLLNFLQKRGISGVPRWIPPLPRTCAQWFRLNSDVAFAPQKSHRSTLKLYHGHMRNNHKKYKCILLKQQLKSKDSCAVKSVQPFAVLAAVSPTRQISLKTTTWLPPCVRSCNISRPYSRRNNDTHNFSYTVLKVNTSLLNVSDRLLDYVSYANDSDNA